MYVYTEAVSFKESGLSQKEKKTNEKSTTHPAAHYHTSSPKCKDSTYQTRDTRAG